MINKLIIVISLAVLPSFAFAEVVFTEIDTNASVYAGSPLNYNNKPASVEDFFNELEKYEKAQQERIDNKKANSSNPLAFSNYLPSSTSGNNNENAQTLVQDPESGIKVALSSNSASKRSGEYGELVGTNVALANRGQASVFNAQVGSAINGGGLLLFLLVLLVFIIIARFTLRKKPLSGSRRPRFYTETEDNFHDMSRYQPRYQ